MKKIKTIFLIIIVMFFLPMLVKAGAIRFNDPVKTSPNTYTFTLTIENMNLNYIQGNLSITNGKITKIDMSSSWINKTGTNNDFYFYHDGRMGGSYTVATIEVTMTDNSEYTVQNLKYGLNKCKIDSYGNYFGENGGLVSKSTYDSTCAINKDASLKSLTVSSGTLSPMFESTLELYNVTVENKVSQITFQATPNHNKTKIISGSTCSLKVGINLCKITTQAEAGNKKTYTITVTRKNASNNTLSNDASISNLQVHGGTLTKTFQPNVKEYDIKVNKDSKKIYFTFTTNSNKQNHTSESCNITEDTKTCRLTITAEDGVTKNSYLFNILNENNKDQTTNNSNTNASSTINASTNNKNNTTNNINNGNAVDNKNENTNTSTNTETIPSLNNPDVEIKTEENTKIDETTNEENVKTEVEKDQIEKIKIPLVNKEIKNENFFKAFAVIDLFLGIGIGIFVAKRYRNK